MGKKRGSISIEVALVAIFSIGLFLLLLPILGKLIINAFDAMGIAVCQKLQEWSSADPGGGLEAIANKMKGYLGKMALKTVFGSAC